jgi:hypothetical protein
MDAQQRALRDDKQTATASVVDPRQGSTPAKQARDGVTDADNQDIPAPIR